MTASSRNLSHRRPDPRSNLRESSPIGEEPAPKRAATRTTKGVPPSVAPCQTEDGDRLLTRTPSAGVLGMPVSTFRRKIEDVLVTPIVEGGVHFFRESELLAIAVHVRSGQLLRDQEYEAMPPRSPAAERGQVAARVFTLLDDGVHKVDVVKQLELEPVVVDELHAQWAHMRGMFVLTPEQADQLDTLLRPWMSGRRLEPTRSAEMLLARLRELRPPSGPQPCANCHAAPPQLCLPCHAQRVDEEKTTRLKISEDGKRVRAQYAADAAFHRSRSHRGKPTRDVRVPLARPSAPMEPLKEMPVSRPRTDIYDSPPPSRAPMRDFSAPPPRAGAHFTTEPSKAPPVSRANIVTDANTPTTYAPNWDLKVAPPPAAAPATTEPQKPVPPSKRTMMEIPASWFDESIKFPGET